MSLCSSRVCIRRKDRIPKETARPKVSVEFVQEEINFGVEYYDATSYVRRNIPCVVPTKALPQERATIAHVAHTLIGKLRCKSL